MKSYQVPEVTAPIFSTELMVSIRDINYGQHLGHDALISLLHEARMQFLASFGYTELNIEGLGLLVTNLYINYLSEGFYADILLIEMEIVKKSLTSFNLLYGIKNKSSHKDLARAEITLTFFDPTKHRVAKIPEQLIEKFFLNKI